MSGGEIMLERCISCTFEGYDNCFEQRQKAFVHNCWCCC